MLIMNKSEKKTFFLFAEVSHKRYFIYWLWSIFIFIILGGLGFLLNSNYIFFLVVVDVFLGIVFFTGAVISFLSDFFSHKIYLRKVNIDKWYLLAVLAIIVFACLFYFKITKDSEIKQKEEAITVMKCLQLGSDNARIACIKKYKPTR